jgi:hypothetical protein
MAESWVLTDIEQAVTAFVRALRSAERLLANQAAKLTKGPGWSQVTFERQPSEWGLFGSDSSQVGFWGYVDAELADIGAELLRLPAPEPAGPS